MYRFGFDAVGAYVLVIALVTMFVALLGIQRQRTGKTIAIWLGAGVLGVLLGCAGTIAALRMADYTILHSSSLLIVPGEDEPEDTGSPGD